MALDVHLGGEKVASLRRLDGGCSLAYDSDAVERLGEERARLSFSLPPREEAYGVAEARPYLEGLLPRGARRRKFAHELGVDPADTYGLLEQLGRDCPGAVVFLPEGEAPAPRGAEELAWLDEEELERMLEAPPERLFEAAEPRRMRFALPGERHKLALVRDEQSGEWAWPEPGAPSTHVVIPEAGHPEYALNEAVCLAALQAMGLLVAVPQTELVGGHRCLVAPRFDRWRGEAGVERLHCETFEQAMGIAPDEELSTMTGLVRCRELLHFIDDDDFARSFFSVGFCAWALGDRDERFGDRISVVYGEGRPMPGLFHGIASTEVYAARDEKVTLFEAAERCSAIVGAGKMAVGMMLTPKQALEPAVEHLFELERLLGGISRQASEEGWHEPVIDEIHECVARRLQYLREEVRG